MMSVVGDVFRSVGNVLYYCAENLWLWAFPQRKCIRDEVVLVTGAGSGIGRLMALKMAELGAELVLWDINSEQVNSVAKEIMANAGKAHPYVVDVTKADVVYATAKMVEREVGRVSILVNNAGVVSGKFLLGCPDEAIVRTMNVNCISHFWTVKAFLPNMLADNHGHIVTVASGAGLLGSPGLVDYSASKFAAVGFDESLRLEMARLGKNGVKTLCVCPYFITTGMFDGASSRFPSLLPLLEPGYAADKIVDSILTDSAVLVMPRLLHIVYYLRALLPTKAFDESNQFLGSLEAMDHFKGRQS